MNVEGKMQKILCWTAQIGNIVLLLLWHALHLVFSIWYRAKGLAYVLESYIISSGVHKRYKSLNLDKLPYLAVVVDSEEAHHTLKIIELLHLLADIGVKNVCLYDPKGLLKKSKEVILDKFQVPMPSEGTVKDVKPFSERSINFEFLSSTDGKDAVAKAANHLFVEHYMDRTRKEPKFAESDIAEALKSVGAAGPEPDLLLIYGPARCHLGFPAWRIRYTEIVHMGSLASMRYGSLVKAIHKFSLVRQNYGR